MPRDRAFLLVLLTFVAAGVAFGAFRGQPERHEHFLATNLPDPQAQVVEQRQIQTLNLGEPQLAGDHGPGALVRGTASRATSDGGLLVLDWRDASIKRYSADGAFRAAYRWSPGGESAAAARPSDFANGPNGEVWVAYDSERAVRVFSADGTPRRTHQLSLPPHRIAVAKDGRFVVLSLGRAVMFYVHRADGTLEHRFGRLIEAPEQEPILLDGSLTSDGAGGFVYAPSFLGVLVSFSLEGDLRFLVKTIDGLGIEVPAIEVRSDGYHTMAAGTPWRSLAVDVVQGRLHVLAERESGRADGRLIDVYDSTHGTYIESYRLPDTPQSAHLTANGLRTVRDGHLWIWG